MSLKFKYILFVSIIHLILITLSLTLIKLNVFYFLGAEIFIIISLAISFILYKQLIMPINTISSGVESIEEKDFSMKFVKVGHPEMDKLIDVYNKMIDELREERLKQEEQHYFLKNLIEASPSGVLVLDFDENITAVNPTALSFMNYKKDEILGKNIRQLEGQFIDVIKNLKEDKPQTVALSGMQVYKCHKASFLDRGFNHFFVMIEQLTDEIVRSEKKAYGKVIRMMSHEINNSIGSVNSILNTCLEYKEQLLEKDAAIFENAVQVAIERNRHLNRFMMNFADIIRLPQPSFKEVDLHKLLHHVRDLMIFDLDKKNIRWEWQIQEEPMLLQVDPLQMEQVLVNIVKNAVESIEKDGFIRLETALKPARYLKIYDSGKGIPAKIKPHLFSPFFSTKKQGQGIGLTLIREILINHNFKFTLENCESGLTCFTINFPVSQ
jgi:nitrogen fixation/metabolism regulation signal transduction histidine kinase